MSIFSTFMSENEALIASNELKESVNAKLQDYLLARSKGKKEAVLDFLLDYYAFRPTKLKVWSPGLLVEVENTPRIRALLSPFKTIESATTICLDASALIEKRRKHMQWVLILQKSIAAKPPLFGCYGLHEWAMLYKSEQKRHPYLSLRVSQQLLDDTVEANPLRCTHYDAYRFFTEPAVPLNEEPLAREEVLQFEQGGCIHNNMDLYKWSFKFYPWLPSELIWKAFNLALKARIVDMEASPYDVRDYGYGAIEIEKPAGMKAYVHKQKELADEAAILRAQWISEITAIIEFINSKTKIANQV